MRSAIYCHNLSSKLDYNHLTSINIFWWLEKRLKVLKVLTASHQQHFSNFAKQINYSLCEVYVQDEVDVILAKSNQFWLVLTQLPYVPVHPPFSQKAFVRTINPINCKIHLCYLQSFFGTSIEILLNWLKARSFRCV